MNSSSTKESAEIFLDPLLSTMGYELVDVQWVVEYGRQILRLFVDREGGVTLDHCSSLSREIGTHLDVQDFMPEQYSLEVSSPGVDRPLRKKKDFERFLGSQIRVQTQLPIEGRSRYKGKLEKLENNNILVIVDKKEYWIAIEAIEKANLVYE